MTSPDLTLLRRLLKNSIDIASHIMVPEGLEHEFAAHGRLIATTQKIKKFRGLPSHSDVLLERLWLFSDDYAKTIEDGGEQMSFIAVCSHLGLEPKQIRLSLPVRLATIAELTMANTQEDIKKRLKDLDASI